MAWTTGLVQRGEGRVHRGDILDVAGQDQRRACALGQRLHPLAERLALIGEGHLRAMGVQGARDAPGDRVLVGDAHDEAALVVHQGEHEEIPEVSVENVKAACGDHRSRTATFPVASATTS